ncbi:MAG: hypothetical protein IGS23_04655 [Rivularia sp. T60_A2020_040]|nr:hypothetical protein [Rivularia sp. T60_A2020_040]
MSTNTDIFPSLPSKSWQETSTTLHLWTQIIGKIRMELTPLINHWWNVTLYVTSRGLTTSPIPYETRFFQIDFDFIAHELCISTSDGERRTFALKPFSVAEFYQKTMDALTSLDIKVKISTMPQEISNPIRFEEDTKHAAYDSKYVHKFWQVLAQSNRIFTDFRSRFIGKVSPTHFFWGSFDLALTRFSGRIAPKHPGASGVADFITHEAYSHEVSSCGFWSGGGGVEPFFYSYTYPEPAGFKDYPIKPEGAYYHQDIQEFVLPLEALRISDSPEETLLSFLQSTYEAAAVLGKWDREALER